MGIDIIGSRGGAVAIIELKEGEDAKKIAGTVLAKHKNVRSVLSKESPRQGKYRIMKLRLLAGSRNTEVIHVENGMRFLLDPRKTYFSPREATERMRIASMVKKNERVCVFFAGVGPLSITVAKKASPSAVTSIEINPAAARYHKKNNVLNKVDVELLKLDVAKFVSKKKFDRIAMPLPEKALEYLDVAIKHLKRGGMCHVYFFCEEGRESLVKNIIADAARKMRRHARIMRVASILPYGPRIWKMRADVKFL